MIIKIIFYLIAVFTLLSLPDSVWDLFLGLTSKIVSGLQKIARKISGGSLIYNGQQVINQMAQLQGDLLIGLYQNKIVLSQYKFYTCLLENTLFYGRTYGAPVRKIFIDIRHGLVKDHQFERKIHKEFLGGIGQFLLIALVTWLFAVLSTSIVEAHSNFPIYLIMGLLQFFGLLVYKIVYSSWKRKRFAPFAAYFSSLYTLRSLSEVGVSITAAVRKSQLMEIIGEETNCLGASANVNKRLEKLIDSWQKKGVPIQNELKEILDEVWFIQEECFAGFIKQIAVFKFLVLALFFLSAYMLFIFSLFNSFLIG